MTIQSVYSYYISYQESQLYYKRWSFCHYNGINNDSKSNDIRNSIDVVAQGSFTSFHCSLELETFLDVSIEKILRDANLGAGL